MKLSKITSSLIFILFLLIFSFSGCKADNKTHIKFSTWGSETEINILNPLIKDFEKQNPDIDVELVHIPQNYFQKLHMLVAANLTPDVIFVNDFNIPVYASGNIFMNLDNKLQSSKKLSANSFFKEALLNMSYKNKLLAIPRDLSNVVIYYNKDLFNKYKVKYPDKSWKFDQLVTTAQALTIDRNKDNIIDIFGISFESLPIYFLPFAWSNSGELFDNSNKKFLLDRKASCEGLQFYADLRNKYHVAPKAYETGNNTMAQLFMQGRLAMYISGRWNVPKFRDEIKFKWDVINFPAGEAGSVVGLDGSGWAIGSSSQHPEAAWKLIEFLASKDSISKFSQTGLIIPARIDVATSQAFTNRNLPPENAKIFLEIIPHSKNTPKIEHWNEVMDLVNTSLEPVWNGSSSACSSLKKINNNVNKLLE